VISVGLILWDPSMGFAYRAYQNTSAVSYEDDGISMFLQGTATKSFFIKKLFTASYYKGDDNTPASLASLPQHMVINNFIKVSKETLFDVLKDRFKMSMSRNQFQHFYPDLVRMHQCLFDLKPGDTIEITYLPDIGTKIFHNDRLMGIIPGQNFGTRFFNIWVGEKPFDRRLKKKMVGNDSAPFVLISRNNE
jgi:hypothetical protein